MTVTKFNFTREGMIPDEPGTSVGDVVTRMTLDEWRKCPEAFLLSDTEDVLVNKARRLLQDVMERYKNVDKKSLNKEVKTRICVEYIEQAKKKRISIAKLKNLTYKLQNSRYWSVCLTEVKIGNGIIERFRVLTSDPDLRVSPDNIIDKNSHPAYFEATNQADRARALGIPELYYYVPDIELDTLRILSVIFKYEPDLQERTAVKSEDSDVFLSVINTKPLNALYSIGKNVKSPEVTKGHNERGKQIDITEYATNLGISISFSDFNPFGTSKEISVGDPNTDKLLIQTQLTCRKTRQKAFEISLTDFMTFRGITDRKTALEQAKKACETLSRARVVIDSDTDKGSVYGFTNYVQECYVVKSSNKGGNKIYINLSDKLYSHILSFSDQGRQIEQLDKRVATIPNNQQTAYNIFREFSSHLRMNPDRSTSHRLSVNTLLNYCSLLPIYPIKDSDIGRPGYLPLRRQAKQKIIEPFTKALEWLVSNNFIKEFTFTHPNGKGLTKAELSRVYDDYNLFSSLNVDVIFTNEPDYDHLIENKAKQRAKADKVKKTKSKQSKKEGT